MTYKPTWMRKAADEIFDIVQKQCPSILYNVDYLGNRGPQIYLAGDWVESFAEIIDKHCPVGMVEKLVAILQEAAEAAHHSEIEDTGQPAERKEK